MFLIVHDFFRIFCNIRKKKTRIQVMCLQKNFLTGFHLPKWYPLRVAPRVC